MTRSSAPVLLVIAALAVACAGERAVETPVFTLQVAPNGAEISETGSATVVAILTSSASVSQALDFTVADVPTGVTAVVSNVQTAGLVTTATISLSESGVVMPGVYTLTVRGTQSGITEAATTLALTIDQSASCLTSGAVCEQWASGATASSEYTSTDWSAIQATGLPNSSGCADDGLEWASLSPNTQEWLELTFKQSVRPTEIQIYEVLGVSSIVKVEVKDAFGAYYVVYTAHPAGGTCPRILTIPVTGVPIAVNAVRVSIDQSALNTWDEIDAVKLVGQR